MLQASAKVSVLLAALVATLTLVGALPAAEPTVRVAGIVRLASPVLGSDRLAVDPSRHVGYYFSRLPAPMLTVLDLTHLRVLTRAPMFFPDGPLTVDSIRHRVFSVAPVVAGRCESSAVWVLDGISLTTQRLRVPCDPALGPMVMDSLSFDAPQSVMSVAGHRGSSTVFREMSVRQDQISLDWEIEQRGLCASDTVLVRMRHGTAAHCALGSSGRAIWIPTWHSRPVPDAVGHAIVRVTETSGPVRGSSVDAETGRVAVAPGDGSVVSYDAPFERRIATMRPEIDAEDVMRARTFGSAFDAESGRLYLVRSGIVEVADIRGDASTPSVVFAMPTVTTAGGSFAVDARLHRIFIPSRNGLIAIEDDRPPITPRSDVPDRPVRSNDHARSRIQADRGAHQIVIIVPSIAGRPSLELRPARPIDRRSGAIEPRRDLRAAFRVRLLIPAISIAAMMRRCRTCAPLRAPPSIG